MGAFVFSSHPLAIITERKMYAEDVVDTSVDLEVVQTLMRQEGLLVSKSFFVILAKN